ncbi:sigma-B regulation protein RsbU (phosphoserine phosphatase) [Roseivivax lentus]|uniref:Sigma-B regulation protein RsbU (Phosphoserine phosphatase) n=1 Tax=Roseivivax lentus TaxID=633194 RepID=A0A1N7JR60_9RHOB|nr:SpoIIE family protein phosphatase [Roseivivax lentus]SIS51842.1 sigma-B regulation protein RsbU (phosphoserine phosphatase) [Roseivivax lentus]
MPGDGAQGVHRVLIVDDSAAHLAVLARLLSRWGYEVVQARTGVEALKKAALCRPDLVLSDWIMPGMDGIAFCRRFREASGDHFSYFILLSSRSEKSEIARGLDAGADDYLSKPVHAQELRARIHAADRIVRMQRELSAKNAVISDTLDDLQGAYAAIDRDLRHARRIQASLVPERRCRFGPVEISLLLQPCGHVGGDLVGAFRAGPAQVALFGIDVSGHGIASSMVAARIAGYLSDHHSAPACDRDRDGALHTPQAVAQRLNDKLTADPGVEEYFTMLYAMIDTASGDMQMVQAGHPNPLLIRRDGSLDFVGTGGLPIGLIDHVTHERIDLRLAPGDRLLVYSDGFVEAAMSATRTLGEAGLAEIVRGIAPARRGVDFLDDLHAGLVRAMPEGASLSDDVSAALVEYRG